MLRRLLFVVSAFLSTFPVLSTTSLPASDSKSLDSLAQRISELTEGFENGVRERVQEAIKAVVPQIRAVDDHVLRTVWVELLKIGYSLHESFSALKKLEAFEYERHVNGENLMVEDPVARKELSELVSYCASLDLLLHEQVLEAQLSLEAALRELRSPAGRRKVGAKYGPLHKLLRELYAYVSAIQGHAELIHRRRVLEASVSQGGTSHPLLYTLNEQLQWVFEALEGLFSDVMSTVHKCQEAKLLPDGFVAFMEALNEL